MEKSRLIIIGKDLPVKETFGFDHESWACGYLSSLSDLGFIRTFTSYKYPLEEFQVKSLREIGESKLVDNFLNPHFNFELDREWAGLDMKKITITSIQSILYLVYHDKTSKDVLEKFMGVMENTRCPRDFYLAHEFLIR